MLKATAGSMKLEQSFLQRLLSPWFILGLLLMTIGMLMNLIGLRHVPLKDMAFILPTIYIATPIFAWIFLGEKPGEKTCIGSVIMLVGVAIFNIPA